MKVSERWLRVPRRLRVWDFHFFVAGTIKNYLCLYRLRQRHLGFGISIDTEFSINSIIDTFIHFWAIFKCEKGGRLDRRHPWHLWFRNPLYEPFSLPNKYHASQRRQEQTCPANKYQSTWYLLYIRESISISIIGKSKSVTLISWV